MRGGGGGCTRMRCAEYVSMYVYDDEELGGESGRSQVACFGAQGRGRESV